MFEMNVVVFEICRFGNIAPTYNDKSLIFKFLSVKITTILSSLDQIIYLSTECIEDKFCS